MPKKNNSPVALPARMDLAADSFKNMKIAVLMFPFSQEVKDFCDDLEQVLRNKEEIRFPYRQLNNGVIACTSTLTYGFEYLETINYIPRFRALAIGRSEKELDIPTPEQIHGLILAWADTWTEYYKKKKGNKDEIESVCTRFLDAIEKIPEDWKWSYIDPQSLIEDINSNNGLGYQAIPSLLATLLHKQTITIQLEGREQKITWRKVQGGGSTKTGLHLVSQPFKASFIETNDKDGTEKEKEGYFAYRLDFHVHTQAGRFNEKGHLKPWIFLHLSSQRYADEPLVRGNPGRDISILMGMNKARIDDYPIDSTLVKLTIKNYSNKYWDEQLPHLLSAFKARPLNTPQEILDNPVIHGNLDNKNDWDKDEYYIIHTEGYQYKEEEQKGRGHGHSIKTGFSLKERADITNEVIKFFQGKLIPDKPMECDIKIPSGKNMPLAMSDYEIHRKSLIPSALKKFTEEERQKYINEKQNIIADAIRRASDNKQIYLFIIYYEEHTRILVNQQLRNAFLLQEGNSFPEWLTVINILINPGEIIDKIPVTDIPSKNKKFTEEIRKGHTKKRQAWQNFLKKNVLTEVKNKTNLNLFAIIEIGKTQVKGIHPKQNIRGAVREACVLENINSQMLQTVEPKKKEKAEEPTSYSKAVQGRVLNAVLDITIRQTGTLYGLPSEIYQAAKIPKNIAQELDVIAFCRVRKNDFIKKTPFQYVIAVRLQATGKVDVLLPNSKQWIPYSQAGIEIGKFFYEVRKVMNAPDNNRELLDRVQMKGGDLVKFAADVLTNHLENQSIVLIEADVWRNEKSKAGSNNKAWFQLKNEYLLEQRDILNFNHVCGHNCQYKRNDEKLHNLLAIIRLRSGNETPQYVTNRQTWDENSETQDFTKLSGFVDNTIPELMHYFSIGRIPDTQKKKQDAPKARELAKTEHIDDIYAANIAYKHQNMVEMLPFFVRSDLQTEEILKALCRAVHWLRTSPAYTKGNIKQPYSMHLGISLIEDLLCILELD